MCRPFSTVTPPNEVHPERRETGRLGLTLASATSVTANAASPTHPQVEFNSEAREVTKTLISNEERFRALLVTNWRLAQLAGAQARITEAMQKMMD
jgi:hypothetical protein